MTKYIESARKKIFWGLDTLKGGKVKAHYDEITFVMENFASEKSKHLRTKNLDNLLSYATKNCSFYENYSDYKGLSDFPVINKSLIRNHFKEFNSDNFGKNDLYEMSTSGSSGTPFKTVQNGNKRLRNTADTIYFKQKAGFEIGYRLYYIRKWFKMHKRSWLTTMTRNIVMVNVTEFTDEYLANFIKKLEKDNSTQVIIAYSSALRELCNYLERIKSSPIKNNLSCIVAMAEGLSDKTRVSLKKYFNAPVLLRYSNLENGILSLQLDDDNQNLQINCASYHIEILNPETDEPVEEGELGRIIVTDLFNYSMPFIRYDTGDLGIITNTDEYFNGTPAFKKVQGRKMDAIFDTNGKIQSTFIIFYLEAYADIKQFQFIQNGKREYELRLNVVKGFNKENELILLFKSYLGKDADIKINYVNEIPQLSSGKRRLTVNNFLQS